MNLTNLEAISFTNPEFKDAIRPMIEIGAAYYEAAKRKDGSRARKMMIHLKNTLIEFSAAVGQDMHAIKQLINSDTGEKAYKEKNYSMSSHTMSVGKNYAPVTPQILDSPVNNEDCPTCPEVPAEYIDIASKKGQMSVVGYKADPEKTHQLESARAAKNDTGYKPFNPVSLSETAGETVRGEQLDSVRQESETEQIEPETATVSLSETVETEVRQVETTGIVSETESETESETATVSDGETESETASDKQLDSVRQQSETESETVSFDKVESLINQAKASVNRLSETDMIAQDDYLSLENKATENEQEHTVVGEENRVFLQKLMNATSEQDILEEFGWSDDPEHGEQRKMAIIMMKEWGKTQKIGIHHRLKDEQKIAKALFDEIERKKETVWKHLI